MKRFQLAHQTNPHVIIQTPKLDLILLAIVVILSVFGLLMVYDSSQVEAFKEFNNSFYYVNNQIIWLVLGFVSLGFFAIFDYHHLQKIALPFLLFSILLLLIVFIPGLGVSAGGAHRWLKIAGMSLQPAEIIKLSTVIFLAALFKTKVFSKPFLILLAGVLFIVGVLQRDLGSSIVFGMIALGMYFVAGISLLRFGLFLLTSGLGIGLFILTSAYRRNRILAFLDPFSDPQGYSYHISQVLIALGSGGLFGLGVGQSRQKFSFIPEVSTDSIFSIVGEEFGFFGCVILITLLGVVIIRGFKIAQSAPDTFGRLLASGLIIWIASQAVINLAAMTALIPLTGVPLPFISYGGSALLANLTAIGILLNISKQANIKV